jgi:hypothetical protein
VRRLTMSRRSVALAVCRRCTIMTSVFRGSRPLFSAVVLLAFTGCGKHYWEASGRGLEEFKTDSAHCIREATGKYGIGSEEIYRACMKANGWRRSQAHDPTDLQFRGPEDSDEFAAPPDPLGERGVRAGADDLACRGPTASRPQRCPRRR